MSVDKQKRSENRTLSEASSELARCSKVFKERLDAMRDAQVGQPGAQSYDVPRTAGHSTVVDDEGVPMPAVSDPTGEAGIVRADGGDQAALDETEAKKLVGRISRDTVKLSGLLAAYKARPAGSIARRETAQANRRDPGCEVCETVGKWTAPHVEGSNAKGNLDRGYRLCVWCWRFVLDFGRLPNVDELKAHHDGRKLRRPA